MAAIRPIVRRFRGRLRRERIFRDRTNPIEIYDDVELYSKFRFTRMHILGIVDEIGRFHAVLYGTLNNIFYNFARTNQEFWTAFWQLHNSILMSY